MTRPTRCWIGNRPNVTFSLQIKSSAFRELKRINKPERIRIIAAIDQLPANPWMGKSLKGGLSGLRRIRVGDYRVVYEVHGQQVVILAGRIAHRKVCIVNAAGKSIRLSPKSHTRTKQRAGHIN